MKIMEKLQTIQDRKKVVAGQVFEALKNRLSNDEYLALRAKVETLAKRTNLDDSDQKELDEAIKKIDKSTVTVETLADFRIAMNLLKFEPDDMAELLAHENAHVNKAQSLDVNTFGYKITLCSDSNGDFYKYTYATIANASKEINYLIAQAPQEYGGDLSEDDIEMLKKFV